MQPNNIGQGTPAAVLTTLGENPKKRVAAVEPSQSRVMEFQVRISATKQITITINQNDPHFPLQKHLKGAHDPGFFGLTKSQIDFPLFYKDLDQLEESFVSSSKFIRDENELGKLILLKKNATPITQIVDFDCDEDKKSFERRMLLLVSKLKKLKPKYKPKIVETTLRDFETLSLWHLASDYFYAGDYQLAEATYIKLVNKNFGTIDGNLLKEDFQGDCYKKLAKIYLHFKMYEAAAAFNQKAVEKFSSDSIFDPLIDYTKDLRIFSEIAEAFQENGSSQKAIEFFEKSLKASEKYLNEMRKHRFTFIPANDMRKHLLTPHFFNMLDEESQSKIRNEKIQLKQIILFLENEIEKIKASLEKLKTESNPPEKHKEVPSNLKTESEQSISTATPIQIAENEDPPQGCEKISVPHNKSAEDSEYQTQLSSLVYSGKAVKTKKNKPRKLATESNSTTTHKTEVSQQAITPTVTPLPGFISRFVRNNQTGVGYIFRLNKKHLDEQIQDEKLRTILENKFKEALFVTGKGKQGFKYAAHEEKAVKSGYFIKLKLLGKEACGNFRLLGRSDDEKRIGDLIEIIFDGIDFNAHSSKSAIITPKRKLLATV